MTTAMTIAMIISIIAIVKYIANVSLEVAELAGVPGELALADSPVSAAEPKYDFVPSKYAVIVYMSLLGGVHVVLNLPMASLVTVPMFVVAPLELVAVNLTWTPFAVGQGACM